MEDLFPNMVFNLVYKDQMISVTVPRTKEIAFLKTKAFTLFGPLRHRITLMYKNKELTPYEERPIISFFKSLRQANVLIVDSATSKKTKIESRSLDKSYSKSGISENLPSIQTSNNIVHDIPQVKRYQTKCCECQREKINFYCRDCAVFLCKHCRMNNAGNHYSHRTVTLYPEDLNKSANMYKEVVNGMLQDARNTQYKLRGTKQKKLNIEEMKEKIMNKFETLMLLIEAMKDDYPNFDYIKENQTEFDQEIDEAMVKVDESEIGEMAMERFDEINEKEKNVECYLKIGNKIEEFEKLNLQIEGLMKSLDIKLNRILLNAENDKANLNNNL